MSNTAVIALAGRRIDAENADLPRFPLQNVKIVRDHLAELFEREQAVALVASAACGSDLIALEEAERLGIRRRIILPFNRLKFLSTSVVDRPGDWKTSYDRLVVEGDSDLLILNEDELADHSAYVAVTNVIIREAKFLATTMPGSPHRLVGVIVWDGHPRPGHDITNDFRNAVIREGFEISVVLTR
jgi:hypothetical protein